MRDPDASLFALEQPRQWIREKSIGDAAHRA
jgi:hypothetical protein